MPINVNTNVPSISAQFSLSKSNTAMQKSLQRLSSGYRINSAADDAAGLAVSENLRAQISGYQQSLRNANDGVAILQTAESAYQTISDTLIRMRELAVQSASDGLSDTERGYLDTEFSELSSEIDRISDVTEYNGQMLLDGTAGAAGTMTFQIGTRNTANDRLAVTLSDMDTTALGVNGEAVDSLANSQGAIDAIDTALDSINSSRATLGANINRLGMSIENLGNTIENLSTANSQIRDTDVAHESAQLAKSQVLQQTGLAMLAQANAAPTYALRLLG